MVTEQIDRDIMRARERSTPTGWSGKLGWRNIAASIGYVALYLALDRLSFIGASESRRGIRLQVSRWPCS